VHVAGAYWANGYAAVLLSQGERYKNRAALFSPANRFEPFFKCGVLKVRRDEKSSSEQALDFGDRNAMPLAFLSIGVVPIKAGKFHA
jgi:hypothetical protein